jgi:hypothetical protein
VEARAADLRLLAREVPQGAYRVQGGACLHLAGRRLSMLVGFRWVDGSGFGDAIRLEHLYHAMLGAMITIASTCARVARAAGVAEPSDPLAWEGWLQPENDLTVTDVVSFGVGLRPDGSDESRSGHFPEARAAGTGIGDLDNLARDWLTYWLLDMGRQGASDFEGWIARWSRPDFLRMPDMALPEPGTKALPAAALSPMAGSMGTGKPVKVINPGLWEQVSAAFPAVNVAIDQHLAAGGRVPSAPVPTMDAFDNSENPRDARRAQRVGLGIERLADSGGAGVPDHRAS